MTPNQSKTSCDQELLSELIDSLIDQQTCYDRELLSELIVTPINNMNLWLINELLTVESSYQSSLSPWEDNTRFAIGSSYQSSLTPRSIKNFSRSGALIRAYWLAWSTKKLVVIGSSNQSSLSPRSTNPLNLWLTGKTFLHFFLDSLIGRQTSRDQELLSELNDSQSIKNVLRLGAHIWAHWLLDRPTNMSWSGALIRAQCQPDRQTLKLWLTNKLFTVESSYQSSLSPSEDNNIVFRSEALIRAHWLPKRPTNMLWSGALIRAHWLPDRPTNMVWSGALIRAHWLPDRPTNMLWSGALIRAHWHPDRQDDRGSLTPWLELIDSPNDQQTCYDRKLLSELIDSPIDQQTCYDQELLPELIDSPDQPKIIVLIGNSYQSSLSPRSTNPLNLWLTD